MNLIEPLLSVYRKIRNSLREWSVRTYAIEVAAEYVDDFEIPGADICDRWDSETDSAIFVVRSNKDLHDFTRIVKGIVSVHRM